MRKRADFVSFQPLQICSLKPFLCVGLGGEFVWAVCLEYLEGGGRRAEYGEIIIVGFTSLFNI